MRAPAGLFSLLLAGVLLLGGCALPAALRGPGAAREAGPFVVGGLVLDTGGLPIGGLPVQVFSSERPVSPDPRLDLKHLTLLAEGETAADGSYRLSFPVKAAPPLRYYLSFFAPGRFDEVRFARPARVDITDGVRAGGFLALDLRLPFHGAWAKVQEVLKAHPKDSAKARIIRAYGIAEEIRMKEGEPGVEVWWYYSKGKNFSFSGDRLVGESSFSPVLK